MKSYYDTLRIEEEHVPPDAPRVGINANVMRKGV
jgi:hypothetical protein